MATESLLRLCFTSNHSLGSTVHHIHLSQKNKTHLYSILLFSLKTTRTLSFLDIHSNFAVLYVHNSWRLEKLAFTLIVESRYLDDPLKTFLQETISLIVLSSSCASHLKTLYKKEKSSIILHSYQLIPDEPFILIILPLWDHLQFLLKSKKL